MLYVCSYGAYGFYQASWGVFEIAAISNPVCGPAPLSAHHPDLALQSIHLAPECVR